MINSMNPDSDRRQNYRIIYPMDYHPVLLIKNTEFEILDLSETGLKFQLKEKIKLPGDLFHAKVKLHDDSFIDIMGRIIRITGEHAAMFLVVKRIPYQFILSEQAFLRQKNEK
jgi:hypothetical protein